MKKTVAALSMALMLLGPAAGVASAQEAAETNLKERVMCLFRVYVTEGGEQGLECLI